MKVERRHLSEIVKILQGRYLSNVTSRQVVRPFPERLWRQFVSVLHRLQGRLAAQG